MQENYELSTGFTQFLLLEGTQGDVRQAVMDTLDVLAQKRLLEDRRASRCIGCTQQLMGQAWGGIAHKAMSEDFFCKVCKTDGMELHSLFTAAELKSCRSHLSTYCPLGFARNFEEAAHELAQDYPRVSPYSGGITALHPRDLLPYMREEIRRQAELGIANKGGADWNKICPAHVRPEAENIDISVLKQLVEEERYLEFNMYFDRNVQLSRLIERLSRIREGLKNQGWGWDHAAIVQDYCRGTLLVMATKGTGTHCHVNWTEACNIAFSWEEGDTEVLAVWYFFDPHIIEPASKWVQQLRHARVMQRQATGPPPGMSGARGLLNKITLTPERVADLRNHLDSLGLLYDAKLRSRMSIVKQRHGEMVHVPAGYMHQVLNVRACTKMELGIYKTANLARYAMSWEYISSQVARAPDDMGAAIVVKTAIHSSHTAADANLGSETDSE